MFAEFFESRSLTPRIPSQATNDEMQVVKNHTNQSTDTYRNAAGTPTHPSHSNQVPNTPSFSPFKYQNSGHGHNQHQQQQQPLISQTNLNMNSNFTNQNVKQKNYPGQTNNKSPNNTTPMVSNSNTSNNNNHQISNYTVNSNSNNALSYNSSATHLNGYRNNDPNQHHNGNDITTQRQYQTAHNYQSYQPSKVSDQQIQHNSQIQNNNSNNHNSNNLTINQNGQGYSTGNNKKPSVNSTMQSNNPVSHQAEKDLSPQKSSSSVNKTIPNPQVPNNGNRTATLSPSPLVPNNAPNQTTNLPNVTSPQSDFINNNISQKSQQSSNPQSNYNSSNNASQNSSNNARPGKTGDNSEVYLTNYHIGGRTSVSPANGTSQISNHPQSTINQQNSYNFIGSNNQNTSNNMNQSQIQEKSQNINNSNQQQSTSYYQINVGIGNNGNPNPTNTINHLNKTSTSNSSTNNNNTNYTHINSSNINNQNNSSNCSTNNSLSYPYNSNTRNILNQNGNQVPSGQMSSQSRQHLKNITCNSQLQGDQQEYFKNNVSYNSNNNRNQTNNTSGICNTSSTIAPTNNSVTQRSNPLQQTNTTNEINYGQKMTTQPSLNTSQLGIETTQNSGLNSHRLSQSPINSVCSTNYNSVNPSSNTGSGVGNVNNQNQKVNKNQLYPNAYGIGPMTPGSIFSGKESPNTNQNFPKTSKNSYSNISVNFNNTTTQPINKSGNFAPGELTGASGPLSSENQINSSKSNPLILQKIASKTTEGFFPTKTNTSQSSSNNNNSISINNNNNANNLSMMSQNSGGLNNSYSNILQVSSPNNLTNNIKNNEQIQNCNSPPGNSSNTSNHTGKLNSGYNTATGMTIADSFSNSHFDEGGVLAQNMPEFKLAGTMKSINKNPSYTNISYTKGNQSQVEDAYDEENNRSSSNLSKTLREKSFENAKLSNISQMENLQRQSMSPINQYAKQISVDNSIERMPTQIENAVKPNNETSSRMNQSKESGEFIFDLKDLKKHLQIQEKQSNSWQEWWNKKQMVNGELILAAQINNFEKCVQLLDQKKGDLRADINTKCENEWTALHYAAFNGSNKLVSFLLYNEAIIDPENKLKQIPLMFAAQKGYEDILQILINAGSDINSIDIDENSAIHYAAKFNQQKIVEILLRRPSLDVRRKNKFGSEPMDLSGTIEIQKVFQMFFSMVQQYKEKGNRVRINKANPETVHQMFKEISNTLEAQRISCPPSTSIPQYNNTMVNAGKSTQPNFHQANNTTETSPVSPLSKSNGFESLKSYNQQIQAVNSSTDRNSSKENRENMTSRAPLNQNPLSQTGYMNVQKSLEIQQSTPSATTTAINPAPQPTNPMVSNINILNNSNNTKAVINNNNNNTTNHTQSSNNQFNNAPIKKKDNSFSNEESDDESGTKGGVQHISEEEKIGPQHFIVHGLIGKGSFGEVYLVEQKDNKMLYAMKVLHKSKVMRHNLTRYAMTERNILSLTNHPFIVKMHFAFQTVDKLFLIMDYCPGGDLGEHLQKEKKFDEDRVKIYLAETILALEDLHQRDVIFRDLKPDNIVLDYQGHALLTDFGLSKEGIEEQCSGAKSFCGSVAYLAPEMLKRCGHGKAVDWYLLGVVMYELLVGLPPYYANNREQLFYNIEKAPLKLPSHLSPEAQCILKALLQRNPAKRLGSGKGDAEEIKAHKFFSDINWDDVVQRKLQPIVPNRKIKISTQFDPNVFEPGSFIDAEKDTYIAGWSFVAPSHNE